MGIVDTRLLARWQASWRRERATRLLPAKWLADERPEARAANELWLDLLSLRLPPQARPASAFADDDR